MGGSFQGGGSTPLTIINSTNHPFRIEMNYLKVYCNLIRKAENRTPPEGYTEEHHTFPKSIFGKNNRIVVLTAKEHYISHLLLWKICKKRYGEKNQKTIKMFYALWSMINGNGKNPRVTNSKFYAKIRMEISKNQIENLEWRKKVKEGVIKSYQNLEYRKRKAEINKNCPNNPKWIKSMEKVRNLNKKSYLIYFDSGEIITVFGLSEWCKNNGYNPSSVKNVLSDKIKTKTHKNIIKVERIN
jgi:hypothetical protein